MRAGGHLPRPFSCLPAGRAADMEKAPGLAPRSLSALRHPAWAGAGTDQLDWFRTPMNCSMNWNRFTKFR